MVNKKNTFVWLVVYILAVYCGWLTAYPLKFVAPVPSSTNAPKASTKAGIGATEPAFSRVSLLKRTATNEVTKCIDLLNNILKRGDAGGDPSLEINRILLEIANHSSIDALTWIYSNGIPYATDGLVKKIIEMAPSSAFADLAKLNEAIVGKRARSAFQLALVQVFSEKETSFCVRFIEGQQEVSSDVAQVLVSALMKSDPTAAQIFIARNTEKQWMSGALYLIYEKLGGETPQVAWSLACGIDSAELRLTAMGSVIRGLSKKSPGEAAVLALEIPKGPARNDALITLCYEWSKSAPAESAAWMRAHLKGAEFSKLSSQTLMLLGVNADPQTLAILDEIPSISLKRQALTYATPVIPADLPAEQAFTTVSNWGSKDATNLALTRYTEEVATKNIDEALKIIADERFPEMGKVQAYASAIVASISGLDGVAEIVKSKGGRYTTQIAAAILARQKSTLSQVETNKLKNLLKIVDPVE